MSLEQVKTYLKAFQMADRVMEFPESSATVELAAKALQTQPERIAKTLSFYQEEGCLLIVTAGDMKIDNAKFKKTFGFKARMLSAEDVLAMTGHAVGGVCPFGDFKTAVSIYLDISLKRFETVFPACGSSHSAIELTCDQLVRLVPTAEWVDVCKAVSAGC